MFDFGYPSSNTFVDIRFHEKQRVLLHSYTDCVWVRNY